MIDLSFYSQALSLGPFQFTLHQVFISVVSTAIVFPPSLAIVTIFRKSRGKRNSVMQSNQSLSKRSRKFRWRKLAAGESPWYQPEQTKMEKFKESVQNMMTYHKRVKYQADVYPESGGDGGGGIKRRNRKKKGFSLPHWTIYIAWARE